MKFLRTATRNLRVAGQLLSFFVFDVPISQLHPFSGWQSVTGQDGLSSWSKAPRSNCRAQCY